MLKEKFIHYISSEKRFSKHTIKSYSADISQFQYFLSSEFDIKNKVGDISFQLIRGWIAFLLESGINPRSVNRKISTLKTYFKFLLREGVIQVNPMLKVISPKLRKRLPVFIEEYQIEDLLDKVEFEDGFVGERNKLIIEMFYVTGIRLSELINIKVTSIDFENSLIRVIGKRNKERIIPLSSNMLEELKNFIQKHEISCFLFTNLDGKKLYNKLVYRVVRRYIGEISSVNKRSPHILRHTFTTHMLNNGADINAIKELLGHANLSAPQVYTHNTIEKLKSVYKQAHPRA